MVPSPPQSIYLIYCIILQENVPPGRLFSAVRGRLRRAAASLQAAIRFRRLSRRESHPPDWFVDKSHQDDSTEKEESPEPKCCGHRVVVDPALPSHYKVILLVVHLTASELS